MSPSLCSVLVGMPQSIHDNGKDPNPWYSGFIKQPVSGPVNVGYEQIQGDGQADHNVHGGREKAILAYCSDHYARWQEELGHSRLSIGAFGENFAFSSLDEEFAAIGDRYRIGSVLIEVSQPRQPCWKLARRCEIPTMPALAIANGRLGWYFRVIEAGVVEAGMPITICDRPHPEWTIARVNRIFFGPADRLQTELGPALSLTTLSPEFTELCRKRFST